MVHYEAIVAGAGPAGLAVMGNLLEARPDARVMWVDPDFEGGRFNKEWREVPSNTKVKLFTDYAKALQPFRDVIEHTPAPNAMTAMAELEQNKGCPIAYAADMCLMLTKGLSEMQQVDVKKGEVKRAEWDSAAAAWSIQSTPSDAASSSQHQDPSPPTTDNLILCTGSYPTTLPLPLPPTSPGPIPLSLTLALQPTHLSPSLPETATVAVIGASHSAVLVLLNLFNLSQASHKHLKVYWFTRSGLQYAEERDGWILRDNTGLKGVAATFARERLEDERLPARGQGWVHKVDCAGGGAREQQMYEEFLPQCSHVITATGFAQNMLPVLRRGGEVLGEGGMGDRGAGLQYDHLNGGFVDGRGEPVRGLYGAGIAFPERVTDPEGNVSMNVGLWKFMKFLKRVVPEWVGNEGEEKGRRKEADSSRVASDQGAPVIEARL